MGRMRRALGVRRANHLIAVYSSRPSSGGLFLGRTSPRLRGFRSLGLNFTVYARARGKCGRSTSLMHFGCLMRTRGLVGFFGLLRYLPNMRDSFRLFSDMMTRWQCGSEHSSFSLQSNSMVPDTLRSPTP